MTTSEIRPLPIDVRYPRINSLIKNKNSLPYASEEICLHLEKLREFCKALPDDLSFKQYWHEDKSTPKLLAKYANFVNKNAYFLTEVNPNLVNFKPISYYPSKEELADQLDKIAKHPLCSSISIARYGNITIITNDILLEDVFTTQVVNFGKFSINISPNNSEYIPEVRRYEGNIFSKSGYWHPHVDVSSILCLGNMKEAYLQAQNECRVFNCYEFIMQALCSYNYNDKDADGPYCNIMEFVGEECTVCGDFVKSFKACYKSSDIICKKCVDKSCKLKDGSIYHPRFIEKCSGCSDLSINVRDFKGKKSLCVPCRESVKND